MKKILIFFLFLFTYTSIMPAQEKDKTYKYWMTIGFLPGTEGSFNFSYNFSFKNNFYKAGYLLNGDTIFGGTGSNGFLFNSFDISIGKRIQYEWFKAALFAGPSYLSGRRSSSNGNYERFYTAGLETDVQLLFRPANEVGIGIGLFGNLNFIKNYSGVNFCITLGNGK